MNFPVSLPLPLSLNLFPSLSLSFAFSLSFHNFVSCFSFQTDAKEEEKGERLILRNVSNVITTLSLLLNEPKFTSEREREKRDGKKVMKERGKNEEKKVRNRKSLYPMLWNRKS